MRVRHSVVEMDPIAKFGILANMVGGNNLFPDADIEDFNRGATWIPDKVTIARRDGQHVEYVTSHCPYWVFRDKSRIYEGKCCEECATSGAGPIN
jgi:hypothetical protein